MRWLLETFDKTKSYLIIRYQPGQYTLPYQVYSYRYTKEWEQWICFSYFSGYHSQKQAFLIHAKSHDIILTEKDIYPDYEELPKGLKIELGGHILVTFNSVLVTDCGLCGEPLFAFCEVAKRISYINYPFPEFKIDEKIYDKTHFYCKKHFNELCRELKWNIILKSSLCYNPDTKNVEFIKLKWDDLIL